jgi:predicted O-methyltransferase YrrM
MEFISEALNNYCKQFSEKEDDLLTQLTRETHLKVLSPRMLSGHLQGQLLTLFSKLKQPKYILEIGTYTGYSAICLAKGLQSDGVLTTIDANEEIKSIAQKYFERSKNASQINFVVGDAKEIIPTLNQKFDIVFIDADKRNYSNYFDLIIDKVNSGGLIIADNVLWSGKIIENEGKMDVDTKALHAFNAKISSDSRIEKMILPFRDGLTLMLKK